ncbi:MAG: AbrB/MazE/SpoVT family DNA-binding domain-containing protein [Proteobacteria bacterium]|nr:AbrB/MazE/SpoVT family DNA-binding domain-containing protein [Pseudomonadota bacterium]
MYKTILSSKYQIYIPKAIRDSLHLKVGQELVFIQDGNSLHLIPRRNIAEVRGILAGVNTQNIRN